MQIGAIADDDRRRQSGAEADIAAGGGIAKDFMCPAERFKVPALTVLPAPTMRSSPEPTVKKTPPFGLLAEKVRSP